MSEDRDEIKPWDRQPGETSRQYEAFCVYRDLGPARSLAEAYRKDRGLPEESTRMLGGWWTKWMSKRNWKKRAEAWDEHLDQVRRKEIEEQHKNIAHEVVDILDPGIQKLADWVQGLSIEQLQELETKRGFDALVKLLKTKADALGGFPESKDDGPSDIHVVIEQRDVEDDE